MKMPRNDLTGQWFNDLFVITYIGNRYYKCMCRCKNYKEVRADHLTTGKVKSCGCLTGTYLSDSGSKPNEYFFTDTVVKGIASTGETFLIDVENYDKIKKHRWRVQKANGALCNSNGVVMARLIMNAPDDMVVDHINHNPLDNRKCNLRLCTQQQNNWNRRVKGVHYNKVRNKWIAKININGQEKYLGQYDTEREAIIKRRMAEKLEFGEYACERE